jgi:AcrR family transcriptional regulator
MKIIKRESKVRGKILETASDLFYTQGYHVTGINEIIEKSGVAKATFYSHFPSKEDLCLSYIHTMNLRDIELIGNELKRRKSPYRRFMASIEVLKPLMLSTQFKGCRFLNMVPEIKDPKNPIRKEGVLHFEALRPILRDLSQELIDSDSKKFNHLNSKKLADDYLTIQMGAIALCEIYHDIWPVDQAIDFVKRLIKK